MADYSSTPLAKKLGIKEGHRVAWLEAPEGLARRLEPLPAAVSLVTRMPEEGDVDVVVLFCRRSGELAARLATSLRRLRANGGLWVAWPKKSSGVATDLDFGLVQSSGLELGVVDNKSCAVDETFSGLRFVVRREHRAAWEAGTRC